MADWVSKLIKGDRYMIGAILFLMVVSLLAVYSSTTPLAYRTQDGNTTYYLLKHGAMLIGGGVILGLTSRIHPKYLAGLAEVMLAVSLVLVLLTMVIGTSINGSSRWLSFGGLRFQPSEIAKISLVLFVAKQLAMKKNPNDAFWPIIVATALICGVIMIENLSTCLLIVCAVGAMMVIGQVSWVKLGMTALVGGVCVALLIALAPMKVVKSNFGRALTWRGRIERYVGSPVFEPIDKAFGFERSAVAFDSKTGKGADNYQANMALAAVSTGGIGGRGPGNSYLKNFLPEAESDFIFSIILEEYGLWGCLLILSAYVTILARARIVASRSRYPFHIYTIVGIAILLSIQALMNMMVGVGLMPVTGQTLPMVSMGGTSNFTTGFAYGIMLSISSTTYANMKKGKQTGKNNR